ncbi:MAG: UDP-N-acetylmuramate dehydrogenase [Pseudomonadota bacterium]|uniref:UDP-N-acetylmuramate dehydrogenase n=1 Tax=Thermithiobacillus tepidarius TaxID=929 RepID=UPI00041B15E2|nr:UDP-N-acetylmuramate dehydrogenase [Thermithiobacillus tepidarius]
MNALHPPAAAAPTAASAGTPAPLRGRLRLGQPMSRYTSWRVGGPADRLYLPKDLADLQHFLRHWAVGPVTWVGLGSNLLVRDGGIRGTVVVTAGALSELRLLDERTVRAGAGVSCAKLARFCANAGLAGAEFLAGVPGTLGGALAMNAGAHGGETWRLVQAVETLDPHGQLQRRAPESFRIGYRSVEGLGDAWFAAAELRLNPDAPTAVNARIREWLERRSQTQPLELPSCGSVFRNPPGDHAARLIESCGLKGWRIGGAQVSEKHANFIVNLGDARAADIETLIRHVAATVEARCGVRLHPEVRVIGEEVDI